MGAIIVSGARRRVGDSNLHPAHRVNPVALAAAEPSLVPREPPHPKRNDDEHDVEVRGVVPLEMGRRDLEHTTSGNATESTEDALVDESGNDHHAVEERDYSKGELPEHEETLAKAAPDIDDNG